MTASDAARLSDALRERVLADPALVLDDPEMMAALLSAGAPEAAEAEDAPRRVVDLRAALVARLERRLAGLREAHEDLTETALETLLGFDQTHQALLALLDPGEGPEERSGDGAPGVLTLAARVRRRLPAALGLEAARLCLALDDDPHASPPRAPRGKGLLAWLRSRGRRRPPETERRALDRLDPDLALLPRELLTAETLRARAAWEARRLQGRKVSQAEARGAVLCRPAARADRLFFPAATTPLGSVALVPLDLAPRRSFGVLALGAADPRRFRSGAATELPALLGATLERLIAMADAAEAGRIAERSGPASASPSFLRREPGA